MKAGKYAEKGRPYREALSERKAMRQAKGRLRQTRREERYIRRLPDAGCPSEARLRRGSGRSS